MVLNPGLPLVGAQVLLLGASVFNRDASIASAQLHRLNVASHNLARSSAASIAGLSGHQAAMVQLAHATRTAAVAANARSKAEATANAIQARSISVNNAVANSALGLQSAEIRLAAAQRKVELASEKLSATLAKENVTEAAAARASDVLTAAQDRLQLAEIGVERATNLNNAAQARATAVSTAVANATRAVTKANVELAIAQNAVIRAKMAEFFSRVADAALALVGRLLLITGALGIIGAGFALFASKTDRDLKFVQGITGATKVEIDALAQVMQQEALRTGIDFSELLRGGTEAVKAGVEVRDIINGVGAAINNLVIASKGELSAEKAGETVALLFNRFNLEGATAQETAANVEHAVNALTATAQRSALDFNGVSDALNKVGVIAHELLGFSIDETLAWIGVLGLINPVGTEVGTTVQRMFLRMAAGPETAKEAMDELGVSVFDLNGKIRPSRDILIDYVRTIRDGTGAMGELTDKQRINALQTIGGDRAIRGLTGALGEGEEAYDSMIQSMSDTDIEKIVDDIVDTSVQKLSILGQEFQRLGRDIGDNLDPSFKQFLGNAKSATKEASGLIGVISQISVERIQQFIDRVGQSIGVIAQAVTQSSLLVGALAGIGTVLAVRTIPQLVTFARVAISAFKAVAVATSITFGPLLLLAAIVAATVKIAIDNWDNLKETFAIIAKVIENLLNALVESFKTFSTNVQNVIISLWTGVVNTFNNALGLLPENVRSGLQAVLNVVTSFAREYARIMSGIFGGLADAIDSIPDSVIASAGPLGVVTKNILGPMLKTMSDFQGEVAAGTPLLEAFSGTLEEAGTKASNAIDGVNTAVDTIKDAVGDATLEVSGFISDIQAQITAIFNQPWADIFPPLPELPEEAGVLPGGDPTTTGAPFGAGGDGAGGGGGGGTADKITKALEDFGKDFRRRVQEVNDELQESLRQTFIKFGTELAQAIQESSTKISEAVTKANQDISNLHTDRLINRLNDSYRDALNTRLEDERDARERTQQDAELAHKRQLEDERRFRDEQRDLIVDAEKDRLDTIADARDEELEIIERAFDRALDLQRKAADDARRVRENVFREQLDAEARQRQKVIDAADKAFADQQQRQLDRLQERHEEENKNLEREEAVAEARQKFEDALVTPRQRVIDARTDLERNAALIRLEFAERKAQEELDADLAALDIRFAEEDAAAARRAEQEAELDRLKAKLEKEAAKRREAQEIADFEFKKQQEVRLNAFRAQLEAEEYAERIAQEDALFARRKEQQIADLEFRKQQEAELSKFRAEQDRLNLIEDRSLEDTEIARQRKLEEANDKFAETQKAARDKLEEEIAQRAFDRQIQSINERLRAEIIGIEAELEERKKRIIASAAEEIAIAKETAEEKLKVIETELIDKMGELLKEFGSVIEPEINAIADGIRDAMNIVRDSAIEAATRLAEAIGAAKELERIQIQRATQLPQFHSGGRVPGPLGKETPILARAGEVVFTPSQLRALMSVRARELSSTSHVETNINNSYTVNANYKNSQTEASVGYDMRALIALARS